MRPRLTAAVFLLAGTPVLAHRLDEYLQGTIVTIEKGRVRAEMTLTPGVAVFPFLISYMDIDRDGVITDSEQRAYAARVLQDLTLKMDGHRLTPELISTRFPAIQEMQEGRGEIQLDFRTDLPPGGRDRRLVLENHHQKQIAAYQVNCLVPRDPQIRIVAQNRNYLQSVYEVRYEQTDVGPVAGLPARLANSRGWLAALALVLLTRLAWLRKRRNPPLRISNDSSLRRPERAGF